MHGLQPFSKPRSRARASTAETSRLLSRGIFARTLNNRPSRRRCRPRGGNLMEALRWRLAFCARCAFRLRAQLLSRFFVGHPMHAKTGTRGLASELRWQRVSAKLGQCARASSSARAPRAPSRRRECGPARPLRAQRLGGHAHLESFDEDRGDALAGVTRCWGLPPQK